ncbi:unnamed protein product [Prorocentrum cordatum]|uniref:Uncharacterized protein n=1 Tax=Prorocentrum cordatum TaxID=2364126 RepID=A0ABN9PAV9_9DINO|nr:unnamed protein product [Polarella glacialis]
MLPPALWRAIIFFEAAPASQASLATYSSSLVPSAPAARRRGIGARRPHMVSAGGAAAASSRPASLEVAPWSRTPFAAGHLRLWLAPPSWHEAACASRAWRQLWERQAESAAMWQTDLDPSQRARAWKAVFMDGLSIRVRGRAGLVPQPGPGTVLVRRRDPARPGADVAAGGSLPGQGRQGPRSSFPGPPRAGGAAL